VHRLTNGERAWASAKFARDWTRIKELGDHWWVRECYIQTIGVVGDAAALSVLREILATDPPKGKPRDASDARCVYYAINAVTRLTIDCCAANETRSMRLMAARCAPRTKPTCSHACASTSARP